MIFIFCSQDRIRTCMMNFERISLYFLFHLLYIASTNSATWLCLSFQAVNNFHLISVVAKHRRSQDRIRTCGFWLTLSATILVTPISRSWLNTRLIQSSILPATWLFVTFTAYVRFAEGFIFYSNLYLVGFLIIPIDYHCNLTPPVVRTGFEPVYSTLRI